MTAHAFTRRAFSIAVGSAATALGAAQAARSDPADNLGISNSSAAIHQEVVFKASPARVYHALTDARRFDKVVLLSGALTSMALKKTPGTISAKPGGAFSLFGSYITGRNIELSPNVRLIQAWRSASWAPHIYSIAAFELTEHPEGAKLIFDQTGFPNGEAVSLATGWREHYWEPLAKVLA